MTIFNTPGKIYLNLGEIDPDAEYDFDMDFDMESITWNTKRINKTDMIFVNEQLYQRKVKDSKMYKAGFKAGKRYNTDLRWIIKQALKHDDPKYFLSNELRLLNDE